MESLLFVGTTDANGDLVITRRITNNPRRLVKVQWFAGDFTDGVDAILEDVGRGAVIGDALVLGSRTLLTLTDANSDAWYTIDEVGGGIVEQELRLTVSSGGASKVGGCRAYFDEAATASADADIRSIGGMTIGANNFSLIAPATFSSGDNTLVADPGDGYQAGLAELSVQNVDTVTRTLIIKHGATIFLQVDLDAGAILHITREPLFFWIAAASTAIVANASAANAIKVMGGSSFVRVAQ